MSISYIPAGVSTNLPTVENIMLSAPASFSAFFSLKEPELSILSWKPTIWSFAPSDPSARFNLGAVAQTHPHHQYNCVIMNLSLVAISQLLLPKHQSFSTSLHSKAMLLTMLTSLANSLLILLHNYWTWFSVLKLLYMRISPLLTMAVVQSYLFFHTVTPHWNT